MSAIKTINDRKHGRARISVATVVFVAWAGSALGVVMSLGREGCAAMPLPVVRSNPAPGWRMEHWLPGDHALTPLLAAQLIQRGARAGWDDQVRTDRSLGALAVELRAAGWRVVEMPERRQAEPTLDILSPDGRIAGAAGYGAAEVRSASAMYDEAVLTAIAQGRRAPRAVPAACVVPSPDAGRRSAAKYLSLPSL